MELAVRLHLVVDALRGASQRKLSQREQVAVPEEVFTCEACLTTTSTPCARSRLADSNIA